MLTAHFEQVRNLVHAEPARQPNEPLIAFVLDADPTIHGAVVGGKTSAVRGCTGTRTAAVPYGVTAATAGGHRAIDRDSSRACHSQPVEYNLSIVTVDGDHVDARAGAARVSSKSFVAALLLEIEVIPRASASNTLENPC